MSPHISLGNRMPCWDDIIWCQLCLIVSTTVSLVNSGRIASILGIRKIVVVEQRRRWPTRQLLLLQLTSFCYLQGYAKTHCPFVWIKHLKMPLGTSSDPLEMERNSNNRPVNLYCTIVSGERRMRPKHSSWLTRMNLVAAPLLWSYSNENLSKRCLLKYLPLVLRNTNGAIYSLMFTPNHHWQANACLDCVFAAVRNNKKHQSVHRVYTEKIGIKWFIKYHVIYWITSANTLKWALFQNYTMNF